MAGYHSDQFFRINMPGSGETTNLKTDNPPFKYPDRTVRVEEYDPRHGAVVPKNYVLQRGYIRNMASYLGDGKSSNIHKCNFQFNPQQLLQQVEASTGVLDPVLQDPGQAAVPRATNVNFQFDMMFDRSMEMNSGMSDIPPNGVNPWQMGEPSQVGVLRDMAAFYGVIGQLITPDNQALMQQALQASVEAQSAVASQEADADSAAIQADLDKVLTNLPGYIQANAANSGFLMPVPVRILFSSLYIVEGYVVSTAVTYTKFNTAMVPMQCVLSVTMEAKYIGFAQDKTFFSWNLENMKNLKIREEKQTAENEKAVYDAASTVLNKMKVRLGRSTNAAQSLSTYLYYKSSNFQVRTSFPSAKGEDDAIGKLFSSDETNPNLTFGAKVDVYGPFTSLSNFRGNLEQYAKDNGTLLLSGVLSDGSVSTLDEWKTASKKDTVSQTFWSLNGSSDGPEGYAHATAWHIIHFRAFCVTHQTGSSAVQAIGETWKAIGPSGWTDSAAIETTLGIVWPTYVDTSAASVPPSNPATSPPAPGSSSGVGKPPRSTGGRRPI